MPMAIGKPDGLQRPVKKGEFYAMRLAVPTISAITFRDDGNFRHWAAHADKCSHKYAANRQQGQA